MLLVRLLCSFRDCYHEAPSCKAFGIDLGYLRVLLSGAVDDLMRWLVLGTSAGGAVFIFTLLTATWKLVEAGRPHQRVYNLLQ